jgi:hypothetical protein
MNDIYVYIYIGLLVSAIQPLIPTAKYHASCCYYNLFRLVNQIEVKETPPYIYFFHYSTINSYNLFS